MITITKDRNMFYITVSGENGQYAFDINSGVMYGKKGKPIKRNPACYDIRTAFRDMKTNVGYAIFRVMEWQGADTHPYARYISTYMGAEKIDALGLQNMHLNHEMYQFINENFALFTKYIRESEGNEVGTSQWAYNFTDYVTWEKGKRELGTYAEHITRQMYSDICNRKGDVQYTKEEWSAIAYYLVKGRVWDYDENSQRVCRYIEACRLMQKTPNKQNNFMREYVETMHDYELRKTEFDNARMALHFAKHSKAFDFTFGNYTIVIPKSAQDIVDEGTNMHHCVGGYAQRVVNGEQYIIFVRHKDTPEKCYITCQVYNDGRIGQYFLAHDRYISSDEDRAFYNALVNHIRSNW